MNEKISISDKKTQAKSQNPVPYVRRKTDSFQSMNSPVDRILFLQRTIGNQAVGELIKSGALQAKLRIGQPNDIYEQEADMVAEHVMSMPDVSSAKGTRVHRKCLKGPTGLLGKDKKDEKLQAKETRGQAPEATPQIEANINALKGGGQPLPESTRAFFEPRFGRDFSQVRVHTDAKAAESAQAVNAKAYTVGQNIVFGAGQYASGMSEDRRLLAHELTHVIQQTNSSTIKNSIISSSDTFKQKTHSAPNTIHSYNNLLVQIETPEFKIMRDIVSGTPFPSGSRGRPPSGLTGCHVFVGGRGIEHWAGLCAGIGNWCIGARHLYIDVYENPTNYALIEAGPDSSGKISGAWVKNMDWEVRGVQWEASPGDCPNFITCLKRKTADYHAAGHPYDITGPNSNSFVWWVLNECGQNWGWSPWPYVAWSYWKGRPALTPGSSSGTSP